MALAIPPQKRKTIPGKSTAIYAYNEPVKVDIMRIEMGTDLVSMKALMSVVRNWKACFRRRCCCCPEVANRAEPLFLYRIEAGHVAVDRDSGATILVGSRGYRRTYIYR